jgi:hypothetical protein
VQRHRVIAVVWFALALLASTGCGALDTLWGKELKPGYCKEHPEDSDCRTTFPDGGSNGRCTSNASCMAPTGVCDLAGSMMCVQCVAPSDTSACVGSSPVCNNADHTCVQCIAASDTSACVGTTPVCNATHTCEACRKHSDCSLSNACLPDGSCALSADVAYVQAGGTGATCTQTSPCGTLDTGVKANRRYVKIAAGVVGDDKSTTVEGKAITILADPGAKLTRTVPGVILEVKNDGADVKIYDLEIMNGTGASNPAVSIPGGGTPKLTLTRVTIDGNQGVGISSTGGIVTVAQSTISENQGGAISVVGGALMLAQSDITLNQGGGVSVSGVGVTFDITNNYVYRNGDPDSGTFGGLMLGIAVAGSNRLEFNTIVDNRAVINSGGVVCNATTFAAPNNIIARNVLGMSTSAPGAQVSINGCAYPTSRIQNDVVGLAFVDPEAPSPFDYKLTSTSNAIDQALTSSQVIIDHDGKSRPIGSQKDIGAFEFKP